MAAEVERLQRDLDCVNASIDNKVEKLEDAGLNVYELSERLNKAIDKIAALQRDINDLDRRQEGNTGHVLECAKCSATRSAAVVSNKLRDASNRLNFVSGTSSTSPPEIRKTSDDARFNARLQKVQHRTHSSVYDRSPDCRTLKMLAMPLRT